MNVISLTYLHSDVSYEIVLLIQLISEVSEKSMHKCDGIEGQNEAIEFAVRTSSSQAAPWIPLQLNYYSEMNSTSTKVIRGYPVPAIGSIGAVEHIHICGDLLRDASAIQFRWMGTSREEPREDRDVWALGNVGVTLVVANKTFRIIEESFGNDELK
jgi:hypothetical protein